jgi:hypothetical protein
VSECKPLAAGDALVALGTCGGRRLLASPVTKVGLVLVSTVTCPVFWPVPHLRRDARHGKRLPGCSRGYAAGNMGSHGGGSGGRGGGGGDDGDSGGGSASGASAGGWGGGAFFYRMKLDGIKLLQTLAVLHADLDAAVVDDNLDAHLGEVLEREARKMNSHYDIVTLNALSKLEAAAAAVSPSGWEALADAVERNAPEMTPRGFATTLTALSKLPATAAAVTPDGWSGMASALHSTAGDMNRQEVASSYDALSKLEGAVYHLSPMRQGLTLVHLSAQCKHFWWDKGYLGGV